MGMWAGIKHALNSSIGTKGFVPLDKLIVANRTLQASNDKIFTAQLKSPEILGSGHTLNTEYVVSKFKIFYAGSIRIAPTYFMGSIRKTRTIVRKNDVIIYDEVDYASYNTRIDTTVEINDEITVSVIFLESGEDITEAKTDVYATIVSQPIFDI